jgi:methyl-accepting chemotaxis protein
MQEQLRAVIAATNEMGRQHDAGMISYRIPSADFPGEYARMVEGTNAMVASHVAVKMRVVELVREYSEGDLRRDMEDLPGEKARITEATRAVKQRLSAINQQIQALASAASAGDFSVRGDESAFSFEFQRMVQGLNQVMAVSDTALTEVSRVLQAIAEGDLTQRVQGRFEGVFAAMQADANASTQRLADIVAGIQNAAEQITTAAREISTGNQDLSRRTEGQAANLEETAASMEELTSTVKQNADSARTANQLASSAAEVASQGGQIIRDVVTTMDGISGSSRKVGEIISVIDGIAFQTNILALNAAVEAARAGEQGRGFAVVASEVRSLAQRSAAAAKEIKDLITDSIERVDQGAGLVGRAGSTMEEIVTSVRRVNDIMSEISAASAEQSAGIEQVNQTITHLDEATQQNAALVEEATAAARSMEEQADALVESVGVFRIG